jgi:methylmalonyl-CoA mutase
MTSSADIPAFAAGFPAADEAQWRGLVDKVLKGGKFERLVGKTADGIAIQPLYPRAATEQPRALPQNPGGWRVLTRIDHRDPVAANAQAKADLADGATGLHLVFAGSAGACGFGLPPTADGVKQALEGIDPAGVVFELDLPADGQHISELMAALIVESGLNPGSAGVAFGLDPIGSHTRSNATADWSSSESAFAQQIGALAKQGFAGPFCVADGRVIQAAGGSEAQELAYVLSAALAYLRGLEAGGDALDAARSKLAFRVAADADQFLTIAKLRALRRLWARVEEACGLLPRAIHIHAETAWRMMTRRDPNVNLLRATVAVFSAAVGGADSISVLPFTQALGLPDAFARRLARNTQLVLLEEANIARVADPAAGSGGLESLTDELARKAWALFQAMETQGGITLAKVRKSLGDDIAAVHAARVKTIATRRTPLTGISEFPNIHESVPDVLEPSATGVATGPFSPVRDAQIFETLRDRAESMSKRPKIFLANYGPLSAFNARATFARNLFEAGGIEAIGNDGFDNATAMAEAFVASGAALACICSSDALYAEAAADCARALRDAGARMIYLAGRPGEDEQSLREAGIGRFAFAGCDAASLLDEALKIS